jgi:hypothetical protein
MQAGDAAGGPADVMPLPRAGAASRGSSRLDHVKATRRKIPGEHLQIPIKEAATVIGVFSSAISRLMNIALISERVPVQLAPKPR